MSNVIDHPACPPELNEMNRMLRKLEKQIFDMYALAPKNIKENDPVYETKARIEQAIKIKLQELKS